MLSQNTMTDKNMPLVKYGPFIWQQKTAFADEQCDSLGLFIRESKTVSSMSKSRNTNVGFSY